MASNIAEPVTVVFAPDFLGHALQDPAGLRVLEYWRDGLIRPALNRALLLRYLKLLRQLGLTDKQIRRWGWWFSAPDRVVWVADDEQETAAVANVCARLAAKARARYLLHSLASPPDRVNAGEPPYGQRVTAQAFLNTASEISPV